MERFKNLGTILTNLNEHRAEIRRITISGKACHHSVPKLLSFCHFSKPEDQDLQNNNFSRCFVCVKCAFLFLWEDIN
jgi:hypothetical protein